MRLIAVGGCSSGVGKTSVVCRLLEGLPGWGALKTTPVQGEYASRDTESTGNHENATRFSVVRDKATLAEACSDTARYLAVGAGVVAWLRYRRDCVDAGIEEALPLFQGAPGVVVEGNSAALRLPSPLVIVVARTGRGEVKPSALSLLPAADYVIVNRARGEEGAEALVERLVARFHPRRIVSLDAERPDDAAALGLLEEIRAWARSPA